MLRLSRLHYLGLSLFFILYLFIQLISLSYWPLPWFDEIQFADITRSFLSSGHFYLDVFPFQEKTEILTYGPVYFFMTGLTTKIFGFSIFTFRIVNFAFGIANLFVFKKILDNYINEKIWSLFAVILLAVDITFTYNIHCGRMDSVAIFFYLCAFLLLMKNDDKLFKVFFSGVLSALAILTTPRIGFLFLSLIFLLLYRIDRKYFLLKIKFILLWITTIIILYSIWVWYAFDGFSYFLKYYTGKNDTGGSLLVFLGGHFNPPAYQFFLIIILVFLIIFNIKKKQITDYYFPKLLIFNILFYYFLVFDTGAYSIYIIYFYYGLLCYYLSKLQFPLQLRCLKLNYIIYSFVLLLNLAIFSYMAVKVLLTWDTRNFKTIDQIAHSFIFKGSKVAANDMYYYSIVKNGGKFQSIDNNSRYDEMAIYHKEVFQFDYIIISKDIMKNTPNLIKAYERFDLEVVKDFSLIDKKPNLMVDKLIRKMNRNQNISYDGIIFKCNKK